MGVFNFVKVADYLYRDYFYKPEEKHLKINKERNK